jgi:hypothetical protein
VVGLDVFFVELASEVFHRKFHMFSILQIKSPIEKITKKYSPPKFLSMEEAPKLYWSNCPQLGTAKYILQDERLK